MLAFLGSHTHEFVAKNEKETFNNIFKVISPCFVPLLLLVKYLQTMNRLN